MTTWIARAGDIFAADVNLHWFEAAATDDMVALKFSDAGFTDVTCSGSGATRYVRGTWPGPTKTIDSAGLDPHLANIRRLSTPLDP